jgi:hypothetical protein
MKRILVYHMIIFLAVSMMAAFKSQIKKMEDMDKKDEELSYAVDVNAQLVPIYAVDKNGNPVFDIKREEIQLFADEKPAEIIFFSGYSVEEQEKLSGKINHPVESQLKTPERVNFIIMDSLFSNTDTFKIARSIALGIIKNAPPDDNFIIMESNQIRGFQFILGPEKNKEIVSNTIRKMKNYYQRHENLIDPPLFSELKVAGSGGGGPFGSPGIQVMQLVIQTQIDIDNDNRASYGSDIRALAQSLAKLEYALKTISLPKTVFLIMGNPQQRRMGDVRGYTQKVFLPVTYYWFMENAVKSLSKSGCIFYLINPLTYHSERKRTEIKFIADAGKGKLIHGTDVPEIVNKVKNSTSAYYEMAFYPDKKPGKKTRIEVKCTRKDVEIITLGYTEQEKNYALMNSMEKKMFALDIVYHGNWSRKAARVGKIKYHESPGFNRENSTKRVMINVPPAMQNRLLELVLVYVNPNTLKATIERKKTIMGGHENIDVPIKKGLDAYFLVIEPQASICIYNHVI